MPDWQYWPFQKGQTVFIIALNPTGRQRNQLSGITETLAAEMLLEGLENVVRELKTEGRKCFPAMPSSQGGVREESAWLRLEINRMLNGVAKISGVR